MRTPTMMRIDARTGRNTLSGTRALRWLPKKMPGREPMTSEPSSTQSTVDAGLSVIFKLNLHRSLLVAAIRMVVQLALVGLVLTTLFSLVSPLARPAHNRPGGAIRAGDY